MPDGGRLQGKVAVITGAGSAVGDLEGLPGTGAAIAAEFVREGARVVAVDLDRSRAENTASALAGEVHVVEADVTQSADCERIRAAVESEYGRLDILVNNVGIVHDYALPHELDEDAWDRVIAVNLRSAFVVSKALIPLLIASGGGSILGIASVAALTSDGEAPYGASKAGLVLLTRNLAVAYGRDGIRANVIAPGYIDTPLAARFGVDPKQRQERERIAPLGIKGSAWDIAHAAVFLSTDEARFVTGVCLPVDGGLTVTSPIRAHQLIADGGDG